MSFLQTCLPPWFLTSVWVSAENRQRNGVEVKAQRAGGRAARISQLIHDERLCHLIDGPPDLTFTKVCRGQRQRSWRGERLSNLLSFIRLIQYRHMPVSGTEMLVRHRKVGQWLVQASELKFGPEKWSFIASSFNYSINWFNHWIKAYKLNFFVQSLYTLSFPQNASIYKYIKISCNAKCNTHY